MDRSLSPPRRSMFNRIYEEWKPGKICPKAIFFWVQSNLWGMETRIHLTHPSARVLFNRIYEEWKLRLLLKFFQSLPSSIESMRNGNNTTTCQVVAAIFVQSNLWGMETSRFRFQGPLSGWVQSNLWGMETRQILPYFQWLWSFNRIYEEWKRPMSRTISSFPSRSIESMRNGNLLSSAALAWRPAVQSNLWGMETGTS